METVRHPSCRRHGSLPSGDSSMVVIVRMSPLGTALFHAACHVLLLSGDMILVSARSILNAVVSDSLLIIDLNNKIGVASWISVAILPLCIFLLVSYAVLPVKWTHRHYLSICFTLGICCMQVSLAFAMCLSPRTPHG